MLWHVPAGSSALQVTGTLFSKEGAIEGLWPQGGSQYMWGRACVPKGKQKRKWHILAWVMVTWVITCCKMYHLVWKWTEQENLLLYLTRRVTTTPYRPTKCKWHQSTELQNGLSWRTWNWPIAQEVNGFSRKAVQWGKEIGSILGTGQFISISQTRISLRCIVDQDIEVRRHFEDTSWFGGRQRFINQDTKNIKQRQMIH